MLELRASCAILVPNVADVSVVDDTELLDGMQEEWAVETVALHVALYLVKHHVGEVYTFDQGGVSGHPNHRDTAKGVEWLLAHRAAAASASAAHGPVHAACATGTRLKVYTGL